MKSFKLHILIFLILSSCDDPFSTTLDIEPPEFQDMAVVIAEASQDNQEFGLFLQKTRTIIPDSEDERLNDATIEVYKDGIFDFRMEKTNFGLPFPNYAYDSSTTIFKPDHEYELRINSDEYGVLRSTSSLPPLVIPESMVLEEDGGLNLTGEDRSAIKIVLNDPVDQENYYQAVVFRTHETEDEFRDTYTEVNDPNFYRNLNYDSVVFSDFTFNGERKSISFLFYPINCCGSVEKFKFYWRNITKEYYEFSRTVEAQNLNDDNPFSSPVQVPSNIENGLGIFSLYNEIVYDIN